MAPSPSPVSPLEGELGEPPAKKRRSDSDANNGPNRRQEACGACRMRKVKCDKKRPICDMCRAKDLDCEYQGDTPKVSRLDHATTTILERLDRLHDDVEGVKQVLGQGWSPALGQGFRGLPQRLSVSATTPRSVVGASPETTGRMDTTSGTTITTITTGTTGTTGTTDPTDPADADPEAVERSRDCLRIPPQRASADSVLEWDVFEHKYPPNTLISVLFRDDAAAIRAPALRDSSSSASVDQERIPALVDSFLQNVHTKNAILDVESLVKHGRRCAEHGVGWDGWSCLVLLACALGSVAQPFGKLRPEPEPDEEEEEAASGEQVPPASDGVPSSVRLQATPLQQGHAWFTLACRRLGSLQYSILGAQCYFFAGVYLMYTLRPIPSWHYFNHASIFCHVHLRMAHGLTDRLSDPLDGTPAHAQLTPAERKARRLEQSLYWSCFKSECEFRVELPLPQSDLSLDSYPNLFPSPPSPITPKDSHHPHHHHHDHTHPRHQYCHDAYRTPADLELRRHAVRLCNEEESWYYYLTEIALRRIGNRIINTFFQQPRSSWRHVKPLLRMAQEFEAQVSSWSANLPPAMQRYKTAATIRAPGGGGGGGGGTNSSSTDSSEVSDGGHVSRELSWAIDNRLLEMQTWLYQPFLYYLVHVGLPPAPVSATESSSHSAGLRNLLNPFPTPDAAADYPPGGPGGPGGGSGGGGPLSAEDAAVLRSLVHAGITCCLKTIDVRAQTHRHHGLWFDLRSTMCASLVLLAVVKSGHAAWIPGGAESLWGPTVPAVPTFSGRGGPAPIGGKLAKVLAQFAFWGAEAPDMLWHKTVLEGVVRDVRGV